MILNGLELFCYYQERASRKLNAGKDVNKADSTVTDQQGIITEQRKRKLIREYLKKKSYW